MIKVAVVGAENVGKSTFVNMITGRKVSEVSEVPGTTKGVVRSRLSRLTVPKHIKNPLGGFDEFMVIDTAGLFDPELELRGKVLSEEKFRRILREIERCDVVVHMVDAQHGLHRGMEKLHHLLKFRYGKPVIVVINKVDLIGREEAERLAEHIKKRLGERPILMSLITGEGLSDVLYEILKVSAYSRQNMNI